MGIISVEQADRLYWLGRYTERVYTTIRLYATSYDIMIDINKGSYDEFCKNLDIPNIYKSPEDFKATYAFGQDDPNSIYSNMMRAYDNAIELRDMIGSECLSYIQLAIYDMNKAKISEAPLVKLQRVMDNILAFWGLADDIIESELCRNTIKIGKRIERIDLYGRLHLSKEMLVREVHRLAGRIDRGALHYRKSVLDALGELIEAGQLDYYRIVQEIEQILE